MSYAPANISLIFKILKNGSLGVGFTVDKGVTAQVYPAKTAEIFYNGKRINFPTVQSVLGESKKVHLRSDLPLGAGFGISGASTLATLYAMNRSESKLLLAKIAHRAEVENKTGLGDVVNQYYGGFLVKRVSSAKFQVERIPLGGTPVYVFSYGKLLTSSVLKNPHVVKQINFAADHALRKINNQMSFSEVLVIAKAFAKESGLLSSKRVIRIIDAIEKRGGHATMIMLGEGVVSDIPFTGAFKVTVSGLESHTVG